MTHKLTRAFEMACTLHDGQVRKGTRTDDHPGVPYISHVMAVAGLVMEHRGSVPAIIGALLHDVVEDRGGRPLLQEIEQQFGAEAASIVEQCSDSLAEDASHKEDWLVRKRRYISSIPSKSDAACLVAACDKLHNARAILADQKEHEAGAAEPVWSRFGGKEPEQTVAYYSAVLAGLRHRQLPLALIRQLSEAVAALEQLVEPERHASWVNMLIEQR